MWDTRWRHLVTFWTEPWGKDKKAANVPLLSFSTVSRPCWSVRGPGLAPSWATSIVVSAVGSEARPLGKGSSGSLTVSVLGESWGKGEQGGVRSGGCRLCPGLPPTPAPSANSPGAAGPGWGKPLCAHFGRGSLGVHHHRAVTWR